MLEKTCIQFSSELATRAPVPGGGSAIAYVSALGIALGNMVGALTVGKKKYHDHQDEINALNLRSQSLRLEFEKMVQADMDAFLPLSRAYGLPSETIDEKKIKDEAMEMALFEAAKIPMMLSKFVLEAIKIHERYSKIGTAIAISDVGTGVLLCKSALQSAQLNVLINTKMMKRRDVAFEFDKEVEGVVLQGCKMADEIYTAVMSQLQDK